MPGVNGVQGALAIAGSPVGLGTPGSIIADVGSHAIVRLGPSHLPPHPDGVESARSHPARRNAKGINLPIDMPRR